MNTYSPSRRPSPGGYATAATLPIVFARTDRLGSIPNPVVPAVTPVRIPTIAGKDLGQPATNIGTEPIIAWTPATTGTPTRYTVSLSEVSAPRGDTNVSEVTHVVVRSTSLRVPPGVLQVGKSYLVRIIAEADVAGPSALSPKGSRTRGPIT